MTGVVDELPASPGRRWGRVLTEVAVVFIGITASFWLDDWRERRQDTETFHRILGALGVRVRLRFHRAA